jgi:hypothetical protein
MASKVFANEDLKRLIFSFGYPEHRAFTRNLTRELHVDMNTFQYHGSITEYIETCTVMEQLKWLEYFNRCRCCSRHSHYKPYINSDYGGMYPVNMGRIPEGNVVECDCPCRSFARYMLIGMINPMDLTILEY